MLKRSEASWKRRLIKRSLALVIIFVMMAGLMPESMAGALYLPQTAEAATLNNPRIAADSSMFAKQRVTWDCVWFGSYPQAEVVEKESDMLSAVGSAYLRNGDYIVDASLYSTLSSATKWDSNGDITINDSKYRRIRKEDATYSTTGDETYYNWASNSGYHYFKYQPIKWRVLNVSNGTALLLADKMLDDRKYNTSYSSVTWKTSTIRSWLNNYKGSQNEDGTDYSSSGFMNTAFDSSEQGAIIESKVINDDNLYWVTEGGKDTDDKIFLLSESEVCSTTKANSYGFVKSDATYDEARRAKSSTFAKAMGTQWSISEDADSNGQWWLRSLGAYWANNAADVNCYGREDYNGVSVDQNNHGARPALNLNLSLNQWQYAGTVCSKILVKKINITGVSKKIAAEKKITLKAIVSPSNATSKAVKWKSSNKSYATVSSTGKVTTKKAGKGKSVIITAIAKDGSGVKATFKIKIMKGVVKRITLSGKENVKAGKQITLKAKVTASKGANKTLKWTSSNTKYATVSSKGVVKGLVKGKTVKITASATDGSGKKATKKIKIK